MTPLEEQLLAVAARSPEIAARRDRSAWVALFTADGRVEDPVGTRPHVGYHALGRFFDTFVEPRSVAVQSRVDIVSEGDMSVIRDVVIEVTMPEGLAFRFPAILRYDLRAEEGELKISSLKAHWELRRMAAQLVSRPRAGAAVSVNLLRALGTNQGARGTLGFAIGLRRTPRRDRKQVVHALAALALRDPDAMAQAWGDALITQGDQVSLSVEELAGLLDRARYTQVLESGSTICVSTSAPATQGVLFVDVGRGARITRARLFTVAPVATPPATGSTVRPQR